MDTNDNIVCLKISDLLNTDFSKIVVYRENVSNWYEDSQEVYCMILNKCVQIL